MGTINPKKTTLPTATPEEVFEGIVDDEVVTPENLKPLVDQKAEKTLANVTNTAFREKAIAAGITSEIETAPVLEATFAWEPASEDGTAVSPDVILVGAQIGDYVEVSAPYDLQGMIAHAYVKEPGVVKVSVLNAANSSLVTASGTWKVRIIPSVIVAGGGGGGGSVDVGDATPKPLGTAAPGISMLASREDHVHPYPTAVQVGAAPMVHTHASTSITDFAEAVDDRVGALIKAGPNVAVTYDDTLNELTISANSGISLTNVSPSGLGTPAVGVAVTAARADHVHAMPNATEIAGMGEVIDDRVSALLVAGQNISLSYNDTANTLTIAAAGVGNAEGATVLEGEIIWDPTSDDGSLVSPAITVTGAKLGDFVDVAPPYNLQGLVCSAYVSGPDTVMISLVNPNGNEVILPSGTWKVRIIPGVFVVGDGSTGGGGTTVNLGSSTPKNLGVAAPGVSVNASREDHIHKLPTPVEIGAAPTTHTHAMGDIGGLSTALLGKTDVGHTHEYTDINGLYEAIDDRVGSLLVAGENVLLNYDDFNNKLTITANIVGGGGSGGGANLGDAEPRPLGVATAGLSANASREDHVHAMPAATSLIGFTEAVQDVIGSTIIAGTNVTVNYNDAANTFTISAFGSGGTGGDAIGSPQWNAAVDARISAPTGQITLPSDPTTDMHAATRRYVEAVGSANNAPDTVVRRDGSGIINASLVQASLLANVSSTNTTTTINAVGLSAATNASPGSPVQMTPRLLYRGRTWDTSASQSKTVELYQDLMPVSGATAALGGNLRWRSSINGGNTNTVMNLDIITGTLTTYGPVVLPADPLTAMQAATKQYVDNAIAGVTGGGGSVAGTPNNTPNTVVQRDSSGGFSAGAIVLAADPTGNLQAATKQYVDANATVHNNCAVATISTGTLALNLALNRFFTVTMNQNVTNLSFGNIPVSGKACKVTLILSQDNTGYRTINWPASVKWSNGVIPTLSGPNKTDIIGLFTVNGGTTWFAVPGGINF